MANSSATANIKTLKYLLSKQVTPKDIENATTQIITISGANGHVAPTPRNKFKSKVDNTKYTTNTMALYTIQNFNFDRMNRVPIINTS